MKRMSFRHRTHVLAMAAATAACVSSCAGPRGAALVSETAPRPGLVQRIYMQPSRPVVGDSLRVTAVLVNRGAAPQEVTVDCMPSTFSERLPVARPPAPAPDTSGLSGVRCLAILIHQLAPGDSIILATAAWGPLLEPGRFPIYAVHGHSPRRSGYTQVVVVIHRR
jgi:hypothetical protein